MSRYFFDLFNGSVALDDEGSDHPDVAAARQYAEEAVREIAAESIRTESHLVLHHRIVIRDERNDEVAVVRFGEVVRVDP